MEYISRFNVKLYKKEIGGSNIPLLKTITMKAHYNKIFRPNIFKHTDDLGDIWYEVAYYKDKRRRRGDMDFKSFDTLIEAKEFINNNY